MSESQIVKLAKAILANTSKIDEGLKAADQPELTFAAEGGGKIPANDGGLQMAKNIAIGAAEELTALLQGPMGAVQGLAAREYDIAALHVVHRFKVAKVFAVGDSITYAELATRVGLPESRLRRILRYAMTTGLFRETESGLVSHTALSRALIEDPGVIAEAGQLTDEQFGAAAHMAEALGKYGDSEQPTQSGWSIANRASAPMFEELRNNHPERARQFSSFMDLWAMQHPTSLLTSDYDWTSLPSDAHIVDVGGGEGNVSVALAKNFPTFRFTVQDLESSIGSAPAKVPADLKERITFQVHDFMTRQTVKDANVFFFRSVFHDWPDEYCVNILRNLIPAMKPGTKVVLNEMCTDHSGLAPPIQRIVRGLDLVMMSLFNGKERGEEDFRQIFERADPRFKFQGGKRPALNPAGIPEKGLLSIMEATWQA